MSFDGSVIGVICNCDDPAVEVSGDSYCQCAIPATKTRSSGYCGKTDPSVPVTPRSVTTFNSASNVKVKGRDTCYR